MGGSDQADERLLDEVFSSVAIVDEQASQSDERPAFLREQSDHEGVNRSAIRGLRGPFSLRVDLHGRGRARRTTACREL